ncbi:MAG: hypothetical protein AAFN70_09110, partial [Planctomycetota bacterium]
TASKQPCAPEVDQRRPPDKKRYLTPFSPAPNVAGGSNPGGAYYQNENEQLVLLQELDITRYNDYEIRFRRGAGPSNEDIASYFINGGLVTSLTRDDVLVTPSTALLTEVRFGEPSSFVGGSVSRYNLVSFAAASAVPEPSSLISLTLLSCCCLVFKQFLKKAEMNPSV